jgi:EAL domain-containing protein (putative c-di-GMP-specific phosphodiesterase class I)|nr:EAL domain-containing protein [Acidithiobacillus ferruginosus]
MTGHVIGHELLAGNASCPNWTLEEWRKWYVLLSVQLLAELLETLEGLFFVNVTSDQLLDDVIWPSLVHESHPRIVIEWVEQAGQVEGVHKEAARRLHHLRDLGCQIAIDDIGAGEDGLGRTRIINPQFCKVDGALFQQCRVRGPEYLRGICHHLSLGGARVVIEWVESEADMRLALSAGAHLGQGYFWTKGMQSDIAEQGER